MHITIMLLALKDPTFVMACICFLKTSVCRSDSSIVSASFKEGFKRASSKRKTHIL